MDQLGEHCFFYSNNTNTYYKIVKYDKKDFTTCVVQKCELELIDKTLSVLDENKKLTKIVETYEKVPYGRKMQMNFKLYTKLLLKDKYDIFEDKIITLSDKYCYRDII